MTMYQVILLLTLTHSSHRSPGKKRCEVVPGGYTGEMIDELMYFAQPDSGLTASFKCFTGGPFVRSFEFLEIAITHEFFESRTCRRTLIATTETMAMEFG